MQRMFGERILELEKYASIPIIEFSDLHKKISGSRLYVILMVVLSLISFVLLIAQILNIKLV